MRKTEAIDLFYPGLAGSPYYRIPALCLLENGDLIAGCDQRQTTESDYGGVIEPVIRIKKAGSDEFSDVIKVLEHPREDFTEPTYTIDMALAPSPKESKTVYMLVDKFKAGGNYKASEKGTGFIKKDGEKYQLLFEQAVNNLLFNRELGRYYIKDGEVFSMDDRKTSYTVTINDSYPYKNLGNLYDDGKLIGNIYSDTSPLQVHQTPYLFFTYSTDGGERFTCPVDITADVATDDMMFIGTCPGRGLVLPTGRIIFPIYYTTENPADIYRNHEKAAVIYSDDEGCSWQMSNSISDLAYDNESTNNFAVDTSESQLLMLHDNRILIFARTTAKKVVYAISNDGGESFSGKLKEVDFESEPFCMLSVVECFYEGKEYILLSNPAGPGRRNGSIKVMEVDGENLTTIAEKQINSSDYSYSVIEKLDDNGNFALVYEQKEEYDNEIREYIKYTEFDMEWLLS